MAANHQSWHISTLKNSSFKHHIYCTYNSHNTHMIHKSLSTTLNLHKASLQIVIYNIVSFQYYPRFNSQGLVRNRSQTKKTWQSVTAQLAMASSTACLAKWLLVPHHGELDCSPSEELWVSRYGELGCSPGERWGDARRGELRSSKNSNFHHI